MTDDSGKIVSFKTRKPIEAPPAETTAPAETPAPVFDADLVKCIETLLEQAKTGAIKGMAAIAWNEEFHTFDRLIFMPTDESQNCIRNNYLYLGGLKDLSDSLSDFTYAITRPEDEEDEEAGL